MGQPKVCRRKQSSKQLTLLCALDTDGRSFVKSIPGASTTITFLTFLEEIHDLYAAKDFILIFDVASSHTCSLVHKWLRYHDVRAELSRAYCPEVVPIEMMFGVMKRNLLDMFSRSAVLNNREATKKPYRL